MMKSIAICLARLLALGAVRILSSNCRFPHGGMLILTPKSRNPSWHQFQITPVEAVGFSSMSQEG